MEARINPFQKTMLYWNDLAPYNAVHVAKLVGELELEKLRNAVDEVFCELQLSDLTIDRQRNRFRYGETIRPVEIFMSPEKKDTRAALNQRTELELNTPFDCVDGFVPYRLFVIQDAGAFYMGLVYFHAIADGEAIIRLFQKIINLYLYNRRPASAESASVCTSSLWSHFPKNPAWIAKWLIALPSHVREIRQCVKTPVDQDQSPRTVFKLFDFYPLLFTDLVRYARRLDVTLNDVFLGALMKALSPYAQEQVHAERRSKMAIAFVTNIRRDLVGLKDNDFGMFLGTNHVSHSLPVNVQLEQAVREINAQTRQIKEKRLYALNLAGQMIGVYMMPRLDRAQRIGFYADHYPLWGGITNMDLSWYWKDLPYDDFFYFRAASIAPAAPLNLVITTVNKKINVAVSSNPCVYKTEDVEAIMNTFFSCLAFSAESRQ